MTTNLTPELQKQISDEAEAITSQISAKDDYHNGLLNGYESGYEIAGKKYALKWQEAEQKAERYEKALKLIEQMSDPGSEWKAICDMKAIATEALAPKQTIDE